MPLTEYERRQALGVEWGAGFDIWAIGKRYNADLAWVAIQVIPELQTFNAYFGTIKQIQERKERFSIPMKPDEIRDHGYERLGVEDEFDPSIRPEWSKWWLSRTSHSRTRSKMKRRRACQQSCGLVHRNIRI